MSKRLALSDLLTRKEQAAQQKSQYMEIECPTLGGSLVFKKLPITTVLKVMDNFDADGSLSENFALNCELIYRHCSVFQSKELQDAYDVAEPYDVVPLVFDGDLAEIGRVAAELLTFYGLGDKTENAVKN